MSSIAVVPSSQGPTLKKRDKSRKETRRRKREQPGNDEEALQQELEVLIEMASCGGLDQYQDST
jgi:hypothetical protein